MGGKLSLSLFFDSRNGFILPWVPERYFFSEAAIVSDEAAIEIVSERNF